jgi:LuxR family maltose regulon positive regulatory protein
LSETATLSNLLWTKLSRPQMAGDVVHRARVRERLERGLDRPLTLVCAPAGYGKTTLLSDWLAHAHRPHAWLSLDESDGDLGAFLSYFVAAVRTACPEACRHTLDLVSAPELPPATLLVTTLANDLEALSCEPACASGRCLILVLDDYHRVRKEAVHTLLANLLQHPPHTLHLILSTRQDPPLPLTVLRARGEMDEIRLQDLRFTSDEVAEFMRRAIEAPLDEQAAAVLAERTEGWAAGLRLAALAFAASTDIDGHLAGLPAENRYVMDYLMSEVFSHAPAATQEFLLKTSILDRLSGPLCDAVTGSAQTPWNGHAYLEWLAEHNLFTWSIDPRQSWYRYHHLLQTLLRSRLEQQYSSQEIAALHARAGAWFAEHGFVEEAIEHALAAGDVAQAARLVEANRHEAMNHEHWPDLRRWLGFLPRQPVNERPELVMAEAWLLHHRSSLPDVPSRLARAEMLLRELPLAEEANASLQGEIDALASQLAYWTGDAERTLALAQRALAATPLEHSYVRCVAWLFAGAALQLRGDYGDALDAYHMGLREETRRSGTYATRLLTGLCFTYWMAGDLSSLLQTANKMLELANEGGLRESADWAHYFRGCAHYQQNSLTAARSDFAAVVAEHRFAHGIVYPHSAFGLAAVYQAQGLAEQARATVESVVMYALERHNASMLGDARAFEARLALMQGRTGEARGWAARADRTVRPAPMPLFYAAPFSLVEILLAQGTPVGREQAARLLARLHEIVRTTHNTRFMIDTLALQALLHAGRHERNAALDALKQAVALAESGRVIRVFVDLGPRMAALLHQLAAQEGPSRFLAGLLAAFPAAPRPERVPSQPTPIEPLSERELEVLALLARRLSNKEVAQELYISPMTVKRHTVNIYQKLAVQGRREAVARGVELGILPAPRE